MRKCARPRWRGCPETTASGFGSLTRSQLMSRIRSEGNKTTELKLIAMLRREKLAGWRRRQHVFGNPDFVWPQKKLALFVDGCFWHGHRCSRNLTPVRNAVVWREKIARTRQRDRRTSRILRSNGWDVLRIWECSLRQKNHRKVTTKIRRHLGFL